MVERLLQHKDHLKGIMCQQNDAAVYFPVILQVNVHICMGCDTSRVKPFISIRCHLIRHFSEISGSWGASDQSG